MPCSGLGVCACLLASAPPFAVAAAAAAAAVAGLTRNLLGVHWCSDTAAGWVLGAVLGYVWGRTDPYGALLRKGSIAVSGSSAASVTAGHCNHYPAPHRDSRRCKEMQFSLFRSHRSFAHERMLHAFA
eukprot:3656915-Pleurochrysis_carterae.AAC.3